MKKISVLLAVIMAVVMSGCSGFVSKDQYQQATNTNDSLMTVALQQGNEIYELSTTLRAVSEQLDQINGQLSISNDDNPSLVQQRDNLLRQLATVQQNIQEKQQALDDLNQRFSEQLNQNKVLRQTIDRLRGEVSGYQREIASYKETVAQQRERIEGLTDQLANTKTDLQQTQQRSEMQQEVIATQDEMLNTAFYIIGSKSRLKDLGILEGGVFSKKRLTRQGFSEEGFTRVDIRQLSELDIPARKAELMSSHPASSYSLEPQANGMLKLVIKDQSVFWSNSHYLVIKTK